MAVARINAVTDAVDCLCNNLGYDYSSELGCGEDECGDRGEGAGNDPNMIIGCYDDLNAFIQMACNFATPNLRGVIQADTLLFDNPVLCFFANDSTVGGTSTESVDETGVFSIGETIPWRSKAGNQEICWLREMLGKEVVVFKRTNCDKVEAYGLNGGLRLSTFTKEDGLVKGDENGINGEFTNTGCAGFKFVGDPAASGIGIMELIFNNNQ